MSKDSMTRGARFAITAGLTAALALGSVCAPFASSAYAASAQTNAELAALTEQVNQAAQQHAEAMEKVEKLDAQIDELADEVLHIEQEVIPEKREHASDAAANLYKMGESSSNIVTMLLKADSLSDFITQTKYLTAVQDDNVYALEQLSETRDDLNAKLAKISESRDEVAREEQRAADALEQVSEAQAALQQRAASEDAAEAAAARRAAEEAAAVQKQMEQQSSGDTSASEESSDAQEESSDEPSNEPSTDTSQGSSESQDTSTSTPDPEPAPEPDTDTDSGGSSSSSSDDSGWMTGVASHYGTGDGFMGGITASGDIVTETSMGVAMLNVPLGTYVEIRYNGRSVVAVVNDRGPYVHGRVIDMQPAVARALGFLSVGVGTVEYRFL
ncbi:RlpA-like double-psi beta-barrel domain-containing protein [Collinsella tanakaei]|uniref:RlpA-like double-psi beta-barrel domain-containing protein n=1 Tax=Collinsella tanakaei TaxID=626935 RepID=UPI0025A3C4D4|nr:RlpA-like double-psi beta-barrel domain-containing protein [Collinsella tanakaei]MDM8301158.1 RlpA-like double-psi beta-barrel domain-containing protein [Collinsella tanakaei]